MKKIRAVNEGSDFCFLSKRETLLQGLHIRGKTKDQHIEESMEYSNRVNREMIRQLDNKCCKHSSNQEADDQLQPAEKYDMESIFPIEYRSFSCRIQILPSCCK